MSTYFVISDNEQSKCDRYQAMPNLFNLSDLICKTEELPLDTV